MSFVRKETLHIIRDPRTMLVVLLMPIVQMTLFGFAISTEINNIDFAVVAPNRTSAIRQQVERLAANTYFTYKGFISPKETDEVKIIQRYVSVPTILAIPRVLIPLEVTSASLRPGTAIPAG